MEKKGEINIAITKSEWESLSLDTQERLNRILVQKYGHGIVKNPGTGGSEDDSQETQTD